MNRSNCACETMQASSYQTMARFLEGEKLSLRATASPSVIFTSMHDHRLCLDSCVICGHQAPYKTCIYKNMSAACGVVKRVVLTGLSASRQSIVESRSIEITKHKHGRRE